MREKLKKLRGKYKEYSIIIGIIIFVMLGAIFCVDTTVKKDWNTMVYPEQEYRNLENEAYKMIQNKDFSVKDKDYNYTITCYDTESNKLKLELKDKDSNIVTVEISEYGKKDQYVKVRREMEYKILHYIGWIISIFLILAIISAILCYGIKLLLILLIPVTFICDKVIEIINKHRYKKVSNEDDKLNQNDVGNKEK